LVEKEKGQIKRVSDNDVCSNCRCKLTEPKFLNKIDINFGQVKKEVS